jgi:putative holliday junction resolvase
LRGRRIAFDYGDVRLGVAVCDPDGILASPLPALKSQDKSLFSSIRNLIDEYLPVKIFVGLPVNMSGTEGDSAEKAKSLPTHLLSNLGLK